MRRPAGPRGRDGHAICPGDQVRLKFLYPDGTVEILEGEWIAVSRLGPLEDGGERGWVVLRHNGSDLWKPLALLVQIEVLQANEAARSDTERGYGDVGPYHR